ncbi:DUF4145 domain-containing protein [Novacetimonas hansenii]|uniref:DUF4145 domain-containing protein n=1 Tax=Novacetimonas hansenii TaxID=436 RepID=A0AAW5EPL5_NOVHA|nr:DUF4145 domain-containing protein [Novacetimonas hansenii]MCJ8352721.1 DUF4145 domain-containing protein [Novacetimonas hansenii]
MTLHQAQDFQYDCPCCNAKYVTFGNVMVGEILNQKDIEQMKGKGIRNVSRESQAVATCKNPDCLKMVVFNIFQCTEPHESGPLHFSGSSWHIWKTAPASKKAQASKLLPTDVRQCMLDAEQTLIADVAPRIARSTFRTALDVATNEVLRQNPGCLGEKIPKNLSSRIDMLAKAGLLTTDLKDWAHGVRGITNEDVHTVEPVRKEEAQEIADITRLILTYLFELPERVKLAKAAADAKKAEGNG